MTRALEIMTRIALSALKIIANVVVVLAFAALAYACFVRYRSSGALDALGLLVVNTLFVVVYIARREAAAITKSPSLWILAFVASCLPLLMRPSTVGGLVGSGSAIQLAGIVLIVGAILSLRRSFGIVPAHRGIRQGGMYRVVRHPLYAAELVALLGFIIANPSAWNVTLWSLLCVMQFLRARAEEAFLGEDPAYQRYRERVRYRLIPYLI